MKKIQYFFITCLLLLIFGLGYYAYALNEKSDNVQKNSYDYSFSELVNYVNNIENYLAKSMISKSITHNAETLSKIWRDSNLAIVYMENIPFDDTGSSKSIKFLNHVSDYTYELAKKSINGEELANQDIENLKVLYRYANDLKNTLNEMAREINNGVLSWDDLKNTSKLAFSDDENINIFSSIESNFDDYEGLIYDGAYSDYIIKNQKLGLIGDEIDGETAKNKIKEIWSKDEVEDIKEGSNSTGGDIDSYNFSVKLKGHSNEIDISISKKGGWIIEIINDRVVSEEKIANEEAISKGKEFLNRLGYMNMKETYSLKEENIVTINYAYEEDGILMYPDLIKVKVALDNAEILGIEAAGYLNSHTDRHLATNIISVEEARNELYSNINIEHERKAVIPLDNNQEVYCYEFEGTVEDTRFLVYINAETGKEEEILILLETEGGTLTI